MSKKPTFKKINCLQSGKDKAPIILKKLYGKPSKTNNKILSEKNIANKFAQDPDTENLLEIARTGKSLTIFCLYLQGFIDKLKEICCMPNYNNNGKESLKFVKDLTVVLLNQELHLEKEEYNYIIGTLIESNVE